MHLLASLAAHGWHSAAWRVSGAAGFAGAAPFRAMARTAERGGLDAVLLGMPTAPDGAARERQGRWHPAGSAATAGSDDRRHRADRPLRLVARRRRRAVSRRAGLRDARSSRLRTHRLDHRAGGTAGTGHPISPHQFARVSRGPRRAWSSSSTSRGSFGIAGKTAASSSTRRAPLSPTRCACIRSSMPDGSSPCAGRSTCRVPCRASR